MVGRRASGSYHSPWTNFQARPGNGSVNTASDLDGTRKNPARSSRPRPNAMTELEPRETPPNSPHLRSSHGMRKQNQITKAAPFQQTSYSADDKSPSASSSIKLRNTPAVVVEIPIAASSGFATRSLTRGKSGITSTISSTSLLNLVATKASSTFAQANTTRKVGRPNALPRSQANSGSAVPKPSRLPRAAGRNSASVKVKRPKQPQSHKAANLPNSWVRTGTFPFLKLPPEVRLMVYAYLVPDKLVPFFRTAAARVFGKPGHIALRHDGEMCSSALLRSCKELNEEASYEFSGSAIFQIKVQPSGTTFCQQTHIELSSSFTVAGIKHLHILLEAYNAPVGSIAGRPAPTSEVERKVLRLRSSLRLISRHLLAAKSIRTLTVVLLSHKQIPDDDYLQESLRITLEPLFGLMQQDSLAIVHETDYPTFLEDFNLAGSFRSDPFFNRVVRDLCPDKRPQIDLWRAYDLFHQWIQKLRVEVDKETRETLLDEMQQAVIKNDLEQFKEKLDNTLQLCHTWVRNRHNKLTQLLPDLWTRSGKLLTTTRTGTPRYIGNPENYVKTVQEAKDKLFQAQNAIFELEKRTWGHKLDCSSQKDEVDCVTRISQMILDESETVKERTELSHKSYDYICSYLVELEKEARRSNETQLRKQRPQLQAANDDVVPGLASQLTPNTTQSLFGY